MGLIFHIIVPLTSYITRESHRHKKTELNVENCAWSARHIMMFFYGANFGQSITGAIQDFSMGGGRTDHKCMFIVW